MNGHSASHLTSVLTRNNAAEVSQHRYTKGGNLTQGATQPFAHRHSPAEERDGDPSRGHARAERP